MSNSTKLLYILPDTAYIAELLPAKKEHTFAIQNFRQINGSFLDDNEFIAENVEKLLKKIDPAEYHLILPDFLFTNTIVDVAESSEANVKKYLKEKLLPNLGLSKETHEIDTFILTQFKDKTKVQLSALEKSVLAPIQKALGEHDLTISHISPLSWTIKSIVSLEPSLTVIQMGSMLYLAQHYIGVDQTISFSIEEPENVMESVKTLKGAEPNIQTLYLVTNQLVENKIKEQLSGTLPIQQLATYNDEDAGIPSHVKQIIETGAKTLDISDFPVPQFPIEKATITLTPTTPAAQIKEEPLPEVPVTELTPPTPLPAPSFPATVAPEVSPSPEPITSATEEIDKEVFAPETTKSPQKLDLDEEDEKNSGEEETLADSPSVLPLPTPSTPAGGELEEVASVKSPVISEDLDEPSDLPEIPETILPATPVLASNVTAPATPAISATVVAPTPVLESGLSADDERDIPVTTSGMTETPNIQPPVAPPSASSFSYPSATPAAKPERTVIKNKNDAGSLLKVIGLTILALVVTVGIGVGIGVGLLSLSEKKSNNLQHSPVADASPATSAQPVASPTLSPAASPVASPTTTAKDKIKVLVVNATTTAGKAGKFKSALQQAGYKSVETGNAKGTYSEKGTYLLGNDATGTAATDFGKALGVTLVSQTDKATEDPQGNYDLVVVIAE